MAHQQGAPLSPAFDPVVAYLSRGKIGSRPVKVILARNPKTDGVATGFAILDKNQRMMTDFFDPAQPGHASFAAGQLQSGKFSIEPQ